MIILNNTGDTLQIVLATGRTTNDLDIISTFRDITTTTFTPNKQLSRSNGTNIVSFISSHAINPITAIIANTIIFNIFLFILFYLINYNLGSVLDLDS